MIHPAARNPSLQLYHTIMHRLGRIMYAIGLGILDSDWRPGIGAIIMYIDIISFLMCMAYTVFVLRHQTYELMQCICVVGVPLRGFISTSALIWYRKPILRIHEHLIWLHAHSESTWQEVLHMWTLRTALVFRFQSLLYMTTGVALIMFPVVYYALYAEPYLMLTIRLPGVDIDAGTGFLAVSAYETLCAYLSVGILLSMDTMFSVLCLMGCAYVHMVRVKCERMADVVDGSGGTQNITRALVAIIVAGNRADQHIDAICECCEGICVLQLFLNGLSLALCVLTGRLTGWVIAYPLGLTFLYAIWLYALLGSALEREGDEMLLAVYEMPWHRMSVHDRRLVVLLLLNWQQPRCVTVFASVKLNVETAQRITNAIYSGYMMLESTL